MYLFLMVILSFSLCYFSYNRTIKLMYEIKNIRNLESGNNKVLAFKILTYLFLFIIFLISMSLSTYFDEKFLVYIFYVYLFFTLIYVKVNLKFIERVVHIMFSSDDIDDERFEGFFCAIKKDKNRNLIAIYRIKNDRINLYLNLKYYNTIYSGVSK